MDRPRVSCGHRRHSRRVALEWGALFLLAGAVSSQRQFDGLGTRHLPPDRDPTMTAALCDVDGDGDADLVLGNFLEQNRLYLNEGGVFPDATATYMPVDVGATQSVAVGDVDGDGDLDLVFGNGAPSIGRQNQLYLNDGAGHFADATAARLPDHGDPTYVVAPCDVDGDGDLDLVVGNFGEQNLLYLNDGTGRFTDTTAARRPA